VALDAAHHEQLLEQLRTLRQRVPTAGPQARRHEEVARPLGGRPGQRGGLHLDEVVAGEHRAGGRVDLGPQAQGVRRTRTAQVEVAMLEPSLLADLDVLVDRERQRVGGRQDLHRVGDDLDLTGGDGRVLVALGASLHRADDLDAELVAQLVRDVLAHDDLRDATGVAQIDEGHAAMVAAPRDPPGEADALADVRGRECSGVMSADHAGVSFWVTCGRRSVSGGVQTSGSAVTWSPERMSFTWSPSSVTNQTNGMPRRSAKRICLPNFCAAGATSQAMPRARSRCATASLCARDSSSLTATRTAD